MRTRNVSFTSIINMSENYTGKNYKPPPWITNINYCENYRWIRFVDWFRYTCLLRSFRCLHFLASKRSCYLWVNYSLCCTHRRPTATRLSELQTWPSDIYIFLPSSAPIIYGLTIRFVARVGGPQRPVSPNCRLDLQISTFSCLQALLLSMG